MKKTVTAFLKSMIARKMFYRFNLSLHSFALHGIGINNGENDRCSGERDFLGKVCRWAPADDLTVLDVGAFIGGYSSSIREHRPTARIYAFEPNPKTLELLEKNAQSRGFQVVRAACSDRNGTGFIYDYGGKGGGSEHATLFPGVMRELHGSKDAVKQRIKLVRIDDFIRRERIGRVHLLKIDAEGNELKVLQGARDAVQNGKVDVVHFEFNEMNVISRTFFYDLMGTLPAYRFYRMLPDGLAPLTGYKPALQEIFAFQNIVAVRDGLDWWRD